MTTQAFAIDAFGARGSLRELPLPALGARDLLVRVEAIGVNPADWKLRDGMDPRRVMPMVLGSDLAGTVVGTGTDAAAWHGRRVVASTAGAYARERVVSADGIVAELAPQIDAVTAATLPVPGMTALALVDRVTRENAATIAITGARGAVGRLATEIARARGCTVVALDRGDDVQRADAAIDTAGSLPLLDTIAAQLRAGGTLVSITYAADASHFAGRDVRFENLNAGSTPFFSAAGLRELLALVARGKLHPHEDVVRPFADALDVLDGVKDGSLRGKYVLTT